MTADVADLAAQLAAVQDGIASLTRHETALKAQLREALPEAGTYPAGGLTVIVQHNRRLNLDGAAALLDDADFAACQVTTLDAKAVRARLSPTQLEQCMKDVGDHKIVLR